MGWKPLKMKIPVATRSFLLAALGSLPLHAGLVVVPPAAAEEIIWEQG